MKKLPDAESLKLAKKYRIPLAKTFLAKNERQAVLYAKKLKYPVALKISSPDIVHKTESGGVILGIKDEKSLREGFQKILSSAKKKNKNKKAKIDGILVQEFIPEGGTELIIGAKTDPQFGPVIMFGLGGIFVEVIKDVAFRLAPVDRKEVQQMIRETKGYKILQGTRGKKPANIKAIEDLLLSVSKMVWTNRRIKELDLNPVFANEKKAIAVDMRVMVE
ncbi:MAG: acetate--CoA ligase family protein [Candidatus Aenigmarchaeota archaeon]|nr:acetate--CoA ligase family protein [Candidatus Aenigmarchaeota archaeon]